jgi:predicted nucleotidyltransferase
MIPEKQINEFVTRMRQAAGENLESIILYGSAASGEFHPGFSNVNLLCILGQVSFQHLSAIAPAVAWWDRQKHRPPLVFTREELERSADVFSIELLDMQRRYRVLFGNDVLKALPIPMNLHGVQVEYELGEKLILLRQHLLLAADNRRRLWDLLLQSLPAFATLFRHALIVLGEAAPDSKRDAIQALALRISFDPSAFFQVLDVRERKADRRQFDVLEVFTRYLSAAQQVTHAVDTMLESPKDKS